MRYPWSLPRETNLAAWHLVVTEDGHTLQLLPAHLCTPKRSPWWCIVLLAAMGGAILG